jgi:hypothetical protein
MASSTVEYCRSYVAAVRCTARHSVPACRRKPRQSSAGIRTSQPIRAAFDHMQASRGAAEDVDERSAAVSCLAFGGTPVESAEKHGEEHRITSRRWWTCGRREGDHRPLVAPDRRHRWARVSNVPVRVSSCSAHGDRAATDRLPWHLSAMCWPLRSVRRPDESMNATPREVDHDAFAGPYVRVEQIPEGRRLLVGQLAAHSDGARPLVVDHLSVEARLVHRIDAAPTRAGRDSFRACRAERGLDATWLGRAERREVDVAGSSPGVRMAAEVPDRQRGPRPRTTPAIRADDRDAA